MDKSMILIWIFFFIFLANAKAVPMYNNPGLPGSFEQSLLTTSPPVNYSLVNVNNSLCWQGHCTTDGSWLTGILYNYNHTLVVYNTWNAIWSSTYNATYNGLINNASYLSTYNSTYDSTTKSWNGNFSNLAFRNVDNNFTTGQNVNGDVNSTNSFCYGGIGICDGDTGSDCSYITDAGDCAMFSGCSWNYGDAICEGTFSCLAISTEPLCTFVNEAYGLCAGWLPDTPQNNGISSSNYVITTYDKTVTTIPGVSQVNQQLIISGGTFVNHGAMYVSTNSNAREEVTVANSESGVGWDSNFVSVITHGSLFPGNYYLNDGTADGGLGMILAQGTRLTKFAIGAYNNIPVYFFTGNNIIAMFTSQYFNFTTPVNVNNNLFVTRGLNVTQIANFLNNVVIAGNLSVRGQVVGNVLFKDNTTINGNGTINGNLLVGGNETINGNLLTNGNGTINGNLVVNGNVSFKRPYGMFSSTQTQTIAVVNTAYPITFNWTEDSYLISKSSDNANFTFQQTGDYLVELSAVFTSAVANKHVQIWVQKNNVNIPRSNTKVELAVGGIESVVAVPFIIDLNTTDKLRIMWASDDTGVQMLYTTNTSYSPETPSIIMTISKNSEIT